MKPEISVNMQSSICIKTAEKVIRFDPFKIAGEPHDADIIFITHDHYDHFSPDDIRKVSKADTLLLAPKNMEKQLSVHDILNVLLLTPDEASAAAGIPVETVASYNIMKPFHPKSAGNLGYVITADGVRIYVAGDTDAISEAKAVKCDIALVPIGGTYTMNAKEAAALINTIKPQIAIPTHYGSIVGKQGDGEAFRKLVDKEIETILLLG